MEKNIYFDILGIYEYSRFQWSFLNIFLRYPYLRNKLTFNTRGHFIKPQFYKEHLFILGSQGGEYP